MGKNINKNQKKAIEEWLKDGGDEDSCPFTNFNYQQGLSRCDATCGKWFPKVKAQLKKDKDFTGCLLCPCQSYSVKYVRKVAKALIK